MTKADTRPMLETDSYLALFTEGTALDWFRYIEKQMEEHHIPMFDDTQRGDTIQSSGRVIIDLMTEIYHSVKEAGAEELEPRHDLLRLAEILSLVLTSWATNQHMAACLNPTIPEERRIRMHTALHEWRAAMLGAVSLMSLTHLQVIVRPQAWTGIPGFPKPLV